MATTDLTIAQGLATIMNDALRNYFGSNAQQIDTTSLQTIEKGFNSIGALPDSMKNGILEQVNVILIYRNYGTMFTESKNPTRTFWRDAVNYGGGIADIYQNILEPITAIQGIWADDFAGKNEEQKRELALNNAAYHFNFHEGTVEKNFHTQTERYDFPISVSELEISKAFTPEGFAGYVSVKIANLQWSAEVLLQQRVIANMKRMVDDGNIVFVGGINLNTESGVTEAVETLRTATDAMKTPDNKWNKSEIVTISDDEDLFLVTTPEYLNRISVRGSANAFNINEYRNKNRVIQLPSGSDLGTNPENGEKVFAMLVDKRAIVMAMRYWKMAPFVPSGSNWQTYFLKIEFIKGYNTFFNAIALSGEAIDDFFTGEGATLSISTILGNINEVEDNISHDGEIIFRMTDGNADGIIIQNATYLTLLDDFDSLGATVVTYNGTNISGIDQSGGGVIVPGTIHFIRGDVMNIQIS